MQYIPLNTCMHLFVCFDYEIRSSCRIHFNDLPIFFRVASLALGQSQDCPSASEVTLNNFGKINQTQALCAYILEIFCIMYYNTCI